MAHWRIWWWLLSATIRGVWEGVWRGAAGAPRGCTELQKGQAALVLMWSFALRFTSVEIFYIRVPFPGRRFPVVLSLLFHFAFPPFGGLSWASPGFIYRLLPVDSIVCAPLHLCQTLSLTTASVWNQKHLHVSSGYCFYLDVKSSSPPWGSDFIYPRVEPDSSLTQHQAEPVQATFIAANQLKIPAAWR